MNLAGFNFKNKGTNKESFEKKHCVATLWEMSRTHERKNSFFKEAETIFPKVRNNYLLRRETCSVFHDIFENVLRTLPYFFLTDIFNFELNCFRLYPSENIM